MGYGWILLGCGSGLVEVGARTLSDSTYPILVFLIFFIEERVLGIFGSWSWTDGWWEEERGMLSRT